MNFQTAKGKKRLKPFDERKEGDNETGSRLNDLFDRAWEVFVIKWDRENGRYIGKTACCALEPV